MSHVVDGGQRPRQANAKEYVDRIAARHIANTVISAIILLRGNNAGKCICELI